MVKERFKLLRHFIKRYRFVDIPSLYRRLLADRFHPAHDADIRLPQGWKAICARTAERPGGTIGLRGCDFLYLTEKIEGFQTNPHIRHVFVDEAQIFPVSPAPQTPVPRASMPFRASTRRSSSPPNRALIS